MMEQMVVDLTQFGLDLDAMPSTPPLTTKLLTPEDIATKFMGITYFKGILIQLFILSTFLDYILIITYYNNYKSKIHHFYEVDHGHFNGILLGDTLLTILLFTRFMTFIY